MTGVIDLGEVGSTPPVDPPSDRTRPGRRPNRPIVAALVLAAVLATVAAAAPLPGVTAPTYLAASSAVQVLVDDDLLVVVDQVGHRDRGGGSTIAVYELPGGDLRWRVPVPDHGGDRLRPKPVNVLIAGDLLLVGSLGMEGVRTAALDTADGSVRWLADGYFVGSVADDAVALWRHLSAVDPGTQEPAYAGSVVQVVEAASGRTRWAGTTLAQGFFVYRFDGGRLAQVVELGHAGGVQVRDARTGQVATAGTFALGHQIKPWQAWAVADLLVTASDDTMTAFDLDDLTPRWSAPTRPLSDVIACAPLLCLTHSGGGMHGLDPADGAIRWVNEGWNMDRDLDRYLLVAPGPRDGLPSTLRLVVDPATGEPVAAGSESWSPLVSDGDGWLGQRYDPFRAETWVARIDPGTSTSRMLLHVRDVVNECWASTRALVCRRGDGGLGVWALPD